MIGIGAMIHHLSGGSERSASEFVGKRIAAARLEDNRFKLDFDDGTKIDIWDNGQSCCEHRWMGTDDDPQDLVGKTLVKIEAKPGPDLPDAYGEHEQCFVDIVVDDWTLQLVNHNEHNGYYGGFGLTITGRNQ